MKTKRKLNSLLGGVFTLSFFVCSSTVFAGDWPIGNGDLKGSRSLEKCSEPTLTKKNVKDFGFVKKWSFPASDPSVTPGSVGHIFQPPAVKNNIIYVADAYGYVRAIDRDGKQLWATCALGIDPVTPTTTPVNNSKCVNTNTPGATGLQAPITVTDNAVYAGPVYGSLIALNLDGTPKWNSVNSFPISTVPPFGHGVWSGAVEIDDKVIFFLNPQGDTAASATRRINKGMLVAAKISDGTKVWQYDVVPNASDAAGPGTFEFSHSISTKLGLVYISTSQNAAAATTGDPQPGEDAILAVKISDGTLAWQFNSRDLLKFADNSPVGGDTWTSQVLFPILEPVDMDMGDGVTVFDLNGKEYVAAGSKMGIFFVLDAATGAFHPKNGPYGFNSFPGSGYPVFPLNFPTVGTGGGYQVDGGYFTKGNGSVRHFNTMIDLRSALTALRPLPTDSQGREVCRHGNDQNPANASIPVCPGFTAGTGVIQLLNGSASKELCRFESMKETLYAPIYAQGLIYTVGTSGKVYMLSAKDCTEHVPAVQAVPAGPFGTSLSISNGRIYVGDGYVFGPGATTSRLVSLGLTNENSIKGSQCDQDDDSDGHDDDLN